MVEKIEDRKKQGVRNDDDDDRDEFMKDGVTKIGQSLPSFRGGRRGIF